MNEPREFWKDCPEAPEPFIIAELRDNPALRGLLQPMSDAAARLSELAEQLKTAQEAQTSGLAERIEIRDTNLIATLREIVDALANVKPTAHMTATFEAPIVNTPAPIIEVKPTIIVEPTPRTWTFTHTFDAYGNLTATKAVPSLT